MGGSAVYWQKKTKLKQFIVPLVEQLIEAGVLESKVTRKKNTGRPAKYPAFFVNIGDHINIEGPTRRRCTRWCSSNKEKRRKSFCATSRVVLSQPCLVPYHAKK